MANFIGYKLFIDMRKLFVSIAAALMLGFSAMADEGMWMLPLLQKLNAGAMKDLGCRLTPDQIYSVNHSSLKDAIVIFGGGCTGEMISDKGLLVTNHHCGYSSIQQLSSDEHNYLEDGFWAMNSNEEIPVPGLSVTFLVNMSDVTEAIEGAKSDEERKAVSEALVKDSEERNPGCDVELTSFYNNNVHYIIVYKVFRDIRFVGAPPASIGKFGGETDNWMWPRHTGDFSMFRVYAGKDNEPAEYSGQRPLRAEAVFEDLPQGHQRGRLHDDHGLPWPHPEVPDRGAAEPHDGPQRHRHRGQDPPTGHYVEMDGEGSFDQTEICQ